MAEQNAERISFFGIKVRSRGCGTPSGADVVLELKA